MRLLFGLWATSVLIFAQDPYSTLPKNYKVEFENEYVRISRVKYFPGDKLPVHNYGHGGGGVTLSWGTAELAAELAAPLAGAECAVLGCGAVGLATARTLQARGAQVTIYARALPPDTTSNAAGAQWWPSFVFDPSAITPSFATQYVRAAHLAYQRFQTLPGERYGIRWTRNYAASDEPDQGDPPDSAASL